MSAWEWIGIVAGALAVVAGVAYMRHRSMQPNNRAEDGTSGKAVELPPTNFGGEGDANDADASSAVVDHPYDTDILLKM